jgi:hypothetical protein
MVFAQKACTMNVTFLLAPLSPIAKEPLFLIKDYLAQLSVLGSLHISHGIAKLAHHNGHQ